MVATETPSWEAANKGISLAKNVSEPKIPSITPNLNIVGNPRKKAVSKGEARSRTV